MVTLSRERGSMVKSKIPTEPKNKRTRDLTTKQGDILQSPFGKQLLSNALYEKNASVSRNINRLQVKTQNGNRERISLDQVPSSLSKLDNEKTQENEETEFGFTFSPTKKPPSKLKELKAFRSESCAESRNPDYYNDSVIDRALRAIKTPCKMRPEMNLSKLNKIKVLSPVPDNDCFSPLIAQKSRDLPKQNIEQPKSSRQSLPFNSEVPDLQALRQKIIQTPSKQITLSARNRQQQQVSPLILLREGTPVLVPNEQLSFQQPIIYSKEAGWKLPIIMANKRRDESPLTKGDSKPSRPKYWDEKWNSYAKAQKGPEMVAILPIKQGIVNYTRSGLDESLFQGKNEPVSAGIDSQRGVRFKAEEMILNKLFKAS